MTLLRKTLETPAGRGQIRTREGQSLSVRYALVVFQTVDDEVDTGHAAGQLEIRGIIEVSPTEGIIDLGEKLFRLKMDDGRCLDAQAKKGDPVSRQWDLVASGPKGLEPC